MEHQLGPASSRKRQLSESKASVQGQWFTLGHQRVERVWDPHGSLAPCGHHAEHVGSRSCKWTQLDISPQNCALTSVEAVHSHSPACRFLLTLTIPSFLKTKYSGYTTIRNPPCAILTLGNLNLVLSFPSQKGLNGILAFSYYKNS